MRDKRLRQALNLAIDRDLLIKSLWLGQAQALNGHQYAEWGDLYDPQRPKFAFDPDRARKLIADRPPWWMRGFLDGSRFAKVPAELSAPFADQTRDPEGRLPPMPIAPKDEGVLAGLAADLGMINSVAHLACSPKPPDLILTEIATTDVVQHAHGYATAASHWALAHADMLVGRLLGALERACRLGDYAIAVASDHGHAPIDTAIHPDAVIPEAVWESEGASLHVVVENDLHRATVVERLAAFGVVQHRSDHVPPAYRSRVTAFSAPPRHSFEPRPPDAPRWQSSGRPAYVSSHGLRPGDPADDRFC